LIVLLALALFLADAGVGSAEDDVSILTDSDVQNKAIQKGFQQKQTQKNGSEEEKEFSLAVPDDSQAQPKGKPDIERNKQKVKAQETKRAAVIQAEEKNGKTKKEEDTAAGLPFTAMDREGDAQLAMPEITQRAVLSRSDINRIVCREPIKDIFYSEEKGARIDFSGKNAFIKFQVKKNVAGSYEYVTIPVDLTVICGDSTYTIIAFPKAVPSQTIHLESGKKIRARENQGLTIFKDQPEKKKVEALIRLAYQDNLPTSFEITLIDKHIDFFKDVSVVLHKSVAVDGEGLILKEYYVIPKVQGIELNEKDFLRKEFVERPFALGFDNLKPDRGGRARLFLVETKTAAKEEDLSVR
jgi:conjugal transfer pilus assembly protein TraK